MPTPPSERNLLFAVLALQNELAKPDDVLAAMQVWVTAKHRSLGELLVEGGALDAEHRRLLDALIEAQLARHGTAEQSLVALDPSSRIRGVLRTWPIQTSKPLYRPSPRPPDLSGPSITSRSPGRATAYSVRTPKAAWEKSSSRRTRKYTARWR